MPIEFNCRFCGAIIRVPDKAKGGKGSCPKCGQRITVPKASTIKPSAPAPELPFELPKAATAPAPDSSDVIFQEFQEDVAADAVDFEDEQFAASPPGEFDYGAAAQQPLAKSMSRRKKKKPTDPGLLIIGGVIVVAMLVIAAFFVVPILTSQKITAELNAATAESLDLPPAGIDKSRIDLSPDDLGNLLKKLELAPATISSASLLISISGSSHGLQISISPGAQHHFYRIDPADSPALRTYLKQRQAELNDQRFREVNQALTGFVTDYLKALTKKSPAENLSNYRDAFAIPALVKGFGNVLVAHHGRTVYRCVYEDADGKLYFVMPAGLTSFEIKGREDASGKLLSPVEISVRVDGKFELPKKAKDPSTNKKSTPKKEEKESPSDDEEMGRDK